MKKVYQVVHQYDVDGGFGDAVPEEKVLMIFESESDAKAFVERFQNPHVYDKPYAYLECGCLYIKEMEIVGQGIDLDEIDTRSFWWLRDGGNPYFPYMDYDQDEDEVIEDLIETCDLDDRHYSSCNDCEAKDRCMFAEDE